MNEHCHHMPCNELRHRLRLYLMKSELLRHLRQEHARWWQLYDRLYSREPWHGEGAERAPFPDPAKEILTRCGMFDSLYTVVQKLDLMTVDDFGHYCKQVFLEIGRLKPTFPDAACSVGVFDETARDLRKYVMQQNDRWAAPAESEPVREPVGVR